MKRKEERDINQAPEKGPFLMYSFMLSIALVLFFILVVFLMADYITPWRILSDSWLNSIIHISILSVLSTFFVCFILSKKLHNGKLSAVAFSFFPVYALIGYAFIAFKASPEDKAFYYSLMCIFAVPPSCLAPLAAWSMYFFKKR